MVSYSLEEAMEKLLPVDGPGDWDRDSEDDDDDEEDDEE